MRPVRLLSEGSVAAEPNIQVIRNAYKAELERVQTQGILAGLLFRHFFSGPHIFGVKSFIASKGRPRILVGMFKSSRADVLRR